MKKSRLSLVKQARLIEHFVAGTMAKRVADLIGVNRNTAAYYFKGCARLLLMSLNKNHMKFLIVRLKWLNVILEEHAKENAVAVLQVKWRCSVY